jgi:hypothetical protein
MVGGKVMAVNYQKTGRVVLPPDTQVPEVAETIVPTPPAVDTLSAIQGWDPPPSDIFLALLSGDVASRGLSWYANQTQSNISTRVKTLKKTAKEIENAFYADGPVH